MSVRFACPQCKTIVKAPVTMAGKRSKCPKCGLILEVPVPKGELLPSADPPASIQQVPFDFNNPPPVRNPPEEPKHMTDFDDAGVATADAAKGPGQKFCHECGALIRANAVVCPRCGVAQPGTEESRPIDRKEPGGTHRIAAGLLAILLPGLGIHKFILGYTNAGIIMLLVSLVGGLLCFGVGLAAMIVISFVEGIIYLTKSEAEFHRVYEVGRREWF